MLGRQKDTPSNDKDGNKSDKETGYNKINKHDRSGYPQISND